MNTVHEVYDPQAEIDMLAERNLKAALESRTAEKHIKVLQDMLDFVLRNQVTVGCFGDKYRAQTPAGMTWGWALTREAAVVKAMDGEFE